MQACNKHAQQHLSAVTCPWPLRNTHSVRCTNSLLRSAGCSDWAMLSAVALGSRLKLAATFSPIVRPSLLWIEDELADLELPHRTRRAVLPTLLLNMLADREGDTSGVLSHAHQHVLA